MHYLANKPLGRLLLDLEGDTLDDDAYLKICRETGRLNDLIERLLKLKRVKEAEHFGCKSCNRHM